MVDAYHPQKIIINSIGIRMVETEEYIALGTLITVIASALALIIKQIESSKCTQKGYSTTTIQYDDGGRREGTLCPSSFALLDKLCIFEPLRLVKFPASPFR